MDVYGVPVVGQALVLKFFFLILTSTRKIGGSLPISWMRNIWHREVNELAQSHTAALGGDGFKPPCWLAVTLIFSTSGPYGLKHGQSNVFRLVELRERD